MISILAHVIANQKLIHALAYLKNYCKMALVQSHNHQTQVGLPDLQDPILVEEETSYGSTTKTTNFTGSPGRAASTSSPDTTTTGCLSELSKATALAPRLP